MYMYEDISKKIKDGKMAGKLFRSELMKKKFTSYNRYTELAFFLFEYLFPLLGIPEKKAEKLEIWSSEDPVRSSFTQDDNNNLFISVNHKAVFRFNYDKKIPESDINLAKKIVDVYYSFSKFRWKSDSSKRPNFDYYTENVAKKNYEMAVQTGISNWIIGNITKNENKIYDLLEYLETWAIKTYEGRKVSFGILVNKTDTAIDPKYNFVEFLKDDYSATLTDCITSVIEIDRDGFIISYHSITEKDEIRKIRLDHTKPYRFSHVLANFINSERVGIFLLSNGDILIAEKGEIRFVKRNFKWLNMSYEAFHHAIKYALESLKKYKSIKLKIKEKLIKAVYASMLDVSFSHSGGIISIIDKIESVSQCDKNGEKTLSDIDNLTLVEKKFQSDSNATTQNNDDIAKISKRNIIKKLYAGKDFCNIDRKLRSELIAMDGACIIGQDGTVYAFGAIIKNEIGSSHGGRGSACEKLSGNGIAVKISTDGYIEMYAAGEIVYVIK